MLPKKLGCQQLQNGISYKRSTAVITIFLVLVFKKSFNWF